MITRNGARESAGIGPVLHRDLLTRPSLVQSEPSSREKTCWQKKLINRLIKITYVDRYDGLVSLIINEIILALRITWIRAATSAERIWQSCLLAFTPEDRRNTWLMRLRTHTRRCIITCRYRLQVKFIYNFSPLNSRNFVIDWTLQNQPWCFKISQNTSLAAYPLLGRYQKL